MPDHVEDPGVGPVASGVPPSAAVQAADVLLDRIQLSLDILLPVKATASEASKFCRALARAGFLLRAPEPGAALDQKLKVGPAPVHLPGGASVSLAGQLTLVPNGAGRLQIRRGSTLLPDPMRALRSLLPSPLAAGRGGEDNLAEPYSPGSYVDLLPRQLRAVAEAVDAFVAALAQAAGVASNQLRGAVRVQQAEFCRDYLYEDGAEHFVRRLRDRPILGSRHERGRFFADQLGNGLAVSWHEGTKNAPERKAYPKRSDLVRVEVSLRSRAVVSALRKRLRVPSAAPSLLGADVADELAHLAHGAEALLNEAVDVLNEALVAVPRTGADFLLAFAPLLRLAAPAPKKVGAAGRPRGAEVEPLANQALERLLAEGKFDMRGKAPSNPVLLALKEMQTAGALAVTPRLPRLFTVAPELEAARQALAKVETSPLGGVDEGEV
ncbi:hypothetical protein [Acidocella aromatica]|uniref:Uncharacterized protein n=1 Tax=Acidocella aromatica TaxID=1303579 RepID=A0A840V8C1_9PROT|nr:hypothetical protein [Acidocella aromatica]MBB5371996.1 hypothetical protein [Acidocella aromatica]